VLDALFVEKTDYRDPHQGQIVEPSHGAVETGDAELHSRPDQPDRGDSRDQHQDDPKCWKRVSGGDSGVADDAHDGPGHPAEHLRRARIADMVPHTFI
jgi:hypothetical protein